jgi:hypothetical protein
MADLVIDDTPVAVVAHPGNLASPGRQLLTRVLSGYVFDKLLRQLHKQDHERGGFRHPTTGFAAAILGVLRNPRTRTRFLQLFEVSPVSNDENTARAVAVAWMISDLAKRFDAEFNKRFPQFCHERHKAQTLHNLGPDFDEHARRQVYTALAHLDAATTVFVRYAVLHAGRCLERDFGGLRAPKLVADLVNDAVGLRLKITERQVRYLCGWEARRFAANSTP